MENIKLGVSTSKGPIDFHHAMDIASKWIIGPYSCQKLARPGREVPRGIENSEKRPSVKNDENDPAISVK